MRSIYLFKSFFFLCSGLLLVNCIEFIQKINFSTDFFIQLALFIVAIGLGFSIRDVGNDMVKKETKSAPRKKKVRTALPS